MSERARSVLEWITGVEDRLWLSEWFDDVLIDHRLAPGSVFLISPASLLSLDLDVFGPA